MIQMTVVEDEATVSEAGMEVGMTATRIEGEVLSSRRRDQSSIWLLVLNLRWRVKFYIKETVRGK